MANKFVATNVTPLLPEKVTQLLKKVTSFTLYTPRVCPGVYLRNHKM